MNNNNNNNDYGTYNRGSVLEEAAKKENKLKVNKACIQYGSEVLLTEAKRKLGQKSTNEDREKEREKETRILRTNGEIPNSISEKKNSKFRKNHHKQPNKSKKEAKVT